MGEHAELDLGPIEARLHAATPGPWRASLERARLGIEYPTENTNYWLPVEAMPENAEFIANARTDIPALIAEIHRLRVLVATEQEHKDALRERLSIIRRYIDDLPQE